jgi:hypothetical protein
MRTEDSSVQHNNDHRFTAQALTEVIGNMAMGTSALLSSRTMTAEKRGKYPCNNRATVLHWLHINRTEKFLMVREKISRGQTRYLFMHKNI